MSTEERLQRLEQLVIQMGRTITTQQEEIDLLRGPVEELFDEMSDTRTLAGLAITASNSGRR